ncbi:MAG: hypothetical protein ACPKQO_07200 [Nitrososphaeraceae archaeon]
MSSGTLIWASSYASPKIALSTFVTPFSYYYVKSIMKSPFLRSSVNIL